MNYQKVLILGSGLAGLSTALYLSESGIKSVVLSKGKLSQTNTWRAQGGIATAYSSSDSTSEHLKDTVAAGDGLCSTLNASRIIEAAPELLKSFIDQGMVFDKNHSDYDLGQEGGHHERRIFHVKDHTGQAFHDFVVHLITEKHSHNIELLDQTVVLDVQKKDDEFHVELKNQEQKYSFVCSQLVLATGGVGKSFLYTSNWEGATADGLKIAHDLGAAIINCELIQFHPTCLYHPKVRHFLITEALRGEGAKLINHQGVRFMETGYPQAELSSRDIVSLAIENEIKTSGKDCVYLDVRHLDRSFLQNRFETVFNFCQKQGIDISKDLIPVVPAAHYFCGGIKTDHTLCKTDISGLYAVGETAHTGLHGANRLASNSLLECIATARFCADEIFKVKENIKFQRHSLKLAKTPIPDKVRFRINALWDETRSLMWNHVGIKRSIESLGRAKMKIDIIFDEISELEPKTQNSAHFMELKSIAFFSKACILSALSRDESRGCHSMVDYPKKNPNPYNTAYKNGAITRELLNHERK